MAFRNGPVTSNLPNWSTMSDSPKRRVGVMVVWAWAMLLALAAVWAVVAVGVAAEVFFLALLPTVMGALLRTKVPDNPIWLVFIFAGAGTLVASTVSGLLESGPPTDPGFLDYASIWFSWGLSSLSFFYPYLLLLYLFPSGRFLNRRWSWAGWYGVLAGLAMALTAAFQKEIGDPFAAEPWSIPNPIGFIPTTVGAGLFVTVLAGLYVVAVGSVVAIAVRYRTAAPDERAQIKWLLFAGALFVLGFFDVVFEVTAEGYIAFVGLLAIPVAVTIAITRYRLYQIDQIISRTVSYAVVVGLLALVFVVGAVWLPTWIAGEQSSLFVVGATLAVAALFNPVRRRVQRLVDRHFNRSAYAAREVAANFTDKLQQTLTVEQLADAWARTVQTSLEPRSMGVWLRVEKSS